MAIAGILLLLRLRPRAARRAWFVLLLAGLANAWFLNLRPANLTGTNMVHQYLGAKYALPYRDFYRLYNAALGRPPFGIRDLDHPPAMRGEDPRERRAWVLDLLRRERIEFDPLSLLSALERLADSTGALERECDWALRSALPAAQVERFRQPRWSASGRMRSERGPGSASAT
jgi:hypothetical protein